MVKILDVDGEGFANYKIIDVDKKIRIKMHDLLDKAENKGGIDWVEFEKYIKEFDGTPNIFCVPISVLDRCLSQVKKERGVNDTN